MNRVFRDKFNESMLVYVYGKVKSGKSSLGNFLAYGKHDPAPEDVVAQPDIEFDVEQVSGSEDAERDKLQKQQEATRKEKKFLVDFFEATACIQYFKKPGFTWIDSPGIHSLTAKNGKLAADYLGCADLVVYTMSSRSSARESDREEIRRIIERKDKLLLVMTRCDELITDEDETGKLIKTLEMLSPEEQEEVRESSINAIIEELGQDAPPREKLKRNTVTLSVQYAEDHPEEPGWSKSGMPDFYAVLGDIAKSEALRLKMQKPLRSILADIHQMQKSVESLKTQLEDMGEQLGKVRSTLEQQTHNLAMSHGLRLDHEIVNIARKNIGDNHRFRQKVEAAAERALQEASDQLARTIAKDTIKLTSDLARQSLNTETLPTYKDIYQTITYLTTTWKRAGTLLGALVGGAVGFVVGDGLPGATIGVTFGTAGGRKVGGWMDGSEKSQVKVGDNSLDVGRAAAESACQWLDATLDKMYISMVEECLVPLQEWLQETQHALQEFDKFLSDKKSSLEQEVES